MSVPALNRERLKEKYKSYRIGKRLRTLQGIMFMHKAPVYNIECAFI